MRLLRGHFFPLTIGSALGQISLNMLAPGNSMPSLITSEWGEADALCQPTIQPRIDEVRVAMPGIRVDVIPDRGHWIQYDAADEVNRLMLEFLK